MNKRMKKSLWALVGTMLVIIITASAMLSKRLHILCFIAAAS